MSACPYNLAKTCVKARNMGDRMPFSCVSGVADIPLVSWQPQQERQRSLLRAE